MIFENDYSRHEKDTGSTEVQILLLSNKINKIKKHLEYHKKDYSALRGMLSEINKRKKCLNYLKKFNADLYDDFIKKIKNNSF